MPGFALGTDKFSPGSIARPGNLGITHLYPSPKHSNLLQTTDCGPDLMNPARCPLEEAPKHSGLHRNPGVGFDCHRLESNRGCQAEGSHFATQI